MKSSVPIVAVVLLLAGCASAPVGPSVMALPGTGKNFDHFRQDDAVCRQYAQSQIGNVGVNEAANESGVRSAAVGTLIGAVAGAAIGGRDAAGVGAGTGLLMGTMAGTAAAQSSGHDAQRAYDNAYIQCMYAKGEQVPIRGAMPVGRPSTPAAPVDAPPPGYMPPPPPGYAPR